MSGIAAAAGQASFVEAAQSPQGIVQQLLSAMAHRGGVTLPSSGRPSAILREAIGFGKGTSWSDENCALGVQLTPRTPEDLDDAQPRRDPATGCVLVWDGRLDNREELASALDMAAHSQPDSEFVLRAFVRWGDGCAARLLGDFAFAVWDPRNRSLFAARDPMGVRPLFYHVGETHFALASEVQALLTTPGVSKQPDEIMVGEALLPWTAFLPVEHTFYRDVRRLPPAHRLRWDARGVRIERFWDIDPQRELRYARRDEYVEQFAELLRQAVSCRLRSHRPVGIFLSGGMDSSGVAALTGQLTPVAGARAFHLQLEGDQDDESPIAARIAVRARLPFRTSPLRAENVLDELESYVRMVAIPMADLSFPNDFRLMHMAASEGCGPLFTGDGSDEVFAFPWAFVADLIRTFQWGRLTRMIVPYSSYFSHPPSYFLIKAPRYLLPRPILQAWRALKWRTAPSWVHPVFARRSGLLDRLREPPPPRRFPSISAQDDYVGLMRGRRVLVEEAREFSASRLGLEYRFPFYDVRLLEFMFAVPWGLKVDGWKFKSFLRQAPSLLPDELRNSERKANYNAFAARHSQAQDWSSLLRVFDHPPRGAEIYVDLPEARCMKQRFLQSQDASLRLAILALATFFLWLQTDTA